MQFRHRRVRVDQGKGCERLLWLLYRTLHDDVIKWIHFRVTGPLCEKFTSHRWLPLTKAVTWSFAVFSAPEQTRRLLFETQSRSLWRHRNNLTHSGMVTIQCVHQMGPYFNKCWLIINKNPHWVAFFTESPIIYVILLYRRYATREVTDRSWTKWRHISQTIAWRAISPVFFDIISFTMKSTPFTKDP